MKEPTVEQLATLARAMGYTVMLDDSVGYGVARALASKTIGFSLGFVFCPHLDAEQAWEVMAWMCSQELDVGGFKAGTFVSVGPQSVDIEEWLAGYRKERESIPHDGTAAGIRSAVVEAAIRVAESMQSAEDDGA